MNRLVLSTCMHSLTTYPKWQKPQKCMKHTDAHMARNNLLTTSILNGIFVAEIPNKHARTQFNSEKFGKIMLLQCNCIHTYIHYIEVDSRTDVRTDGRSDIYGVNRHTINDRAISITCILLHILLYYVDNFSVC